MKFHIYILSIDGTRDDQTSACFRDSFGNLISVSVFKRTIINVSLAKNLTETLSVSIRLLGTRELAAREVRLRERGTSTFGFLASLIQSCGYFTRS